MTDKTTKRTGKQQELYVASIYRKLGARTVEHNVELAGNQIDVYVELEAADKSLHRIAVESKEWTTAVGIDIVNNFATIVDNLRRGKFIDEGAIVSKKGFSKQARSAAKAHGIRLLEPEDLIALIDGTAKPTSSRVQAKKRRDQKKGRRVTLPEIAVIPQPVYSIQDGSTPEDERPKIDLHPSKKILQKISFDYTDSPSQHGWQIREDADVTQPTFKRIVDKIFSGTIEIQSTRKYAMDYNVDASAQVATRLEFIAKYTSNAVIYAHVIVETRGSSNTRDVWLAFLPGSGQPKPYEDGTSEWLVFHNPVRQKGAWPVFQVDLRDAVEDTFGKNGWIFKHLIGFRIRGNISIAQISVLE